MLMMAALFGMGGCVHFAADVEVDGEALCRGAGDRNIRAIQTETLADRDGTPVRHSRPQASECRRSRCSIAANAPNAFATGANKDIAPWLRSVPGLLRDT